MSEVSSEPVIAPLPTPISVEPRVAAPAEAAEVARQSEEAALAANSRPSEAKKPEVAKEEVKKPLSTREALRAAREKVNAEPASPLKVEAKAEPVAAAKEPVAKAADTKAAEPVKDAPVARGEDGKFVSTKPAAEPVAAETKVTEPAAKVAEPAPAAPKPSFTAEPPPPRISAKAKEEWATLPEESRAEVLRMEREFKAGFEKHRAAAERDQSLAEFHEMAGKSNKQLRDVVSAYVSMENELRADPIKGFEAIAQNLGIPLKDIAARILNQTPEESASKADQRVISLEKEIAELKQGFTTLHSERTQAKTDTATQTVTEFAAAHPRFEELAEDIAFFLKTRHPGDLSKAYEAAERLNPAPAAPAPTPAPVASAAPVVTLVPPVTPAASAAANDAGQKSIAGAPSAGSDPVRKQPSTSIKEAIRRATARAG